MSSTPSVHAACCACSQPVVADFVAKVFWSSSTREVRKRFLPGLFSELGFSGGPATPHRILSVDPSIRRQSDFCNKIGTEQPPRMSAFPVTAGKSASPVAAIHKD